MKATAKRVGSSIFFDIISFPIINMQSSSFPTHLNKICLTIFMLALFCVNSHAGQTDGVPSVDLTGSTVIVEGELLWEDLEGGMWNLRSGSNLYDLHGAISLEDGDWARVTGVLGGDLTCVHLRGTVLSANAVEKIRAPRAESGWMKFERSMVCFDGTKKEMKVLYRSRRKKLVSAYEGSDDSGPPRYKAGGVLSDGKQAWAIFLDNSFNFFDASGKALWGKPQTAQAIFSDSGASVFLAQRDPGCSKYKAIDDCDLFAVLVSTAGEPLLAFNEAPLLDRDSLYLAEGGLYGFVKVYKTIEGTIFFDAVTKKKKVYEGLGLPKINARGEYKMLGKTGESSGVREIYSGTLAPK